MEMIAKITKLKSAGESVSMDEAIGFLVGCSQSGIPHTVLGRTTLTLTVKLNGSINSINEFKNRFTVYDCRRHFKWEDISVE